MGNLIPILDEMCPKRTFHIKNHRPEWVTNELLEQIKDRDHFYSKARRLGDEDSWNIAKYLRNITNNNIRAAKKGFVLDQLENNNEDCKKFWKVIVPSDKQLPKQDVLLKDNGKKLNRKKVANFINHFFINVGNDDTPDNNDLSGSDGAGNVGASDDTDLNVDSEHVIPLVFEKVRE